ncbi:MAG: hypothetical protein PUC53_01285 [Bacteroidales bacterium]|nr:hypothetical protein [Bacteroidales bacterium]
MKTIDKQLSVVFFGSSRFGDEAGTHENSAKLGTLSAIRGSPVTTVTVGNSPYGSPRHSRCP